MTYEVFIPLWAHVAALPIFATISTFVVVKVIWSIYRGHMNRKAILRRLEALR